MRGETARPRRPGRPFGGARSRPSHLAATGNDEARRHSAQAARGEARRGAASGEWEEAAVRGEELRAASGGCRGAGRPSCEGRGGRDGCRGAPVLKNLGELWCNFLERPLSQSRYVLPCSKPEPATAGFHRVKRGDVVARARRDLRKQKTSARMLVQSRVKVAAPDARGVMDESDVGDLVGHRKMTLKLNSE
ncbi:hypothetical protein T492DRAFT_207074 [Pavlovales sp. CCMP2436]|nr:hypothetical protein T492DRAFT_207074 [Pavlovales sp. CCMP2436]